MGVFWRKVGDAMLFLSRSVLREESSAGSTGDATMS